MKSGSIEPPKALLSYASLKSYRKRKRATYDQGRNNEQQCIVQPSTLKEPGDDASKSQHEPEIPAAAGHDAAHEEMERIIQDLQAQVSRKDGAIEELEIRSKELETTKKDMETKDNLIKILSGRVIELQNQSQGPLLSAHLYEGNGVRNGEINRLRTMNAECTATIQSQATRIENLEMQKAALASSLRQELETMKAKRMAEQAKQDQGIANLVELPGQSSFSEPGRESAVISVKADPGLKTNESREVQNEQSFPAVPRTSILGERSTSLSRSASMQSLGRHRENCNAIDISGHAEFLQLERALIQATQKTSELEQLLRQKEHDGAENTRKVQMRDYEIEDLKKQIAEHPRKIELLEAKHSQKVHMLELELKEKRREQWGVATANTALKEKLQDEKARVHRLMRQLEGSDTGSVLGRSTPMSSGPSSYTSQAQGTTPMPPSRLPTEKFAGRTGLAPAPNPPPQRLHELSTEGEVSTAEKSRTTVSSPNFSFTPFIGSVSPFPQGPPTTQNSILHRNSVESGYESYRTNPDAANTPTQQTVENTIDLTQDDGKWGRDPDGRSPSQPPIPAAEKQQSSPCQQYTMSYSALPQRIPNSQQIPSPRPGLSHEYGAAMVGGHVDLSSASNTLR